jgi:hypothetical protein
MAGMRFRLLALPAAAALAAGCSWFSASLEVRAQAPQAPEHWRRAFPELRFELASPDAECPAADLPAGEWATLRLPKRANWPVLAYPWARGVRLPPAGGLFPLDLGSGGDSMVLSWEHGPAAELLQSLVRQGLDIGCLNVPRLVEEMLERSDGNPGSLDQVFLAERLASGQFRVTDIRLLPTRDLELDVPPATWFLESPFRAVEPPAEGSVLVLPAVPLGPHRLFAVELPGGYDLFASEREVLLAAFQ